MNRELRFHESYVTTVTFKAHLLNDICTIKFKQNADKTMGR